MVFPRVRCNNRPNVEELIELYPLRPQGLFAREGQQALDQFRAILGGRKGIVDESVALVGVISNSRSRWYGTRCILAVSTHRLFQGV